MSYSEPFTFVPATDEEVPVLISVPHCGTLFPDEIRSDYNSLLIADPDDTDWYVDQLYSFAPAMGMSMISAKYSRWVIDLNRDPASRPLYNDGRIITGLCPTTTFLGEPLYVDSRIEVATKEVARRLHHYYEPYHRKIATELARLNEKFGVVLLWDCHSIRRRVPTINKDEFPDLVLGDVDSTSASPGLIQVTLRNLESGKYQLSHNHPFKGGHITRFFGRPSENQHALQLEMSKVNYMDDGELHFHPDRAREMRQLLQRNFADLIDQLQSRNNQQPL